ncbi:Cytochrome b561/ferric reductase transmembrane family protein [Hibiscus syriacus]|uniref:Cytochrome b561/ferric reductase transmembrane family protein n=1 Tax=Hibiscus syriacus TaxID=106335 RepID=A0A6A2X9Y4_HIBSY|nr:Cytochrome b561/ferric reductase transmembrane family protein [Hibiscus syriacus]
MRSTTAFPSSLFIAPQTPSFLPRRGSSLSFFTSPASFVCYQRSSNSRILRISASLLHRDADIAWFPPEPNSLPDEYGGWAAIQAPPTPRTRKKGFSSILVGCAIGSSLAIAISIAYFLFYRKGFKFELRCPLNTFHGVFSCREAKSGHTEARDYLESDEEAAEAVPDYVPLAVTEIVPSAPSHNRERIVVRVAVDSTQQEALSVLKKLKACLQIIEDDVRPDELCTRREYARWLVCTSSLLERNPRHRIVPSIALSGSETAAFDDVSADDPDFESIQALAEVGIIPSKLSGRNTASEGSKGVFFFPDRFISREDLINWKALVEYDFEPGVMEQSRYQGQRAEMKEIKSELLEKGEIQSFWNEKLDEERARGSEVEKLYFLAVQDLEQEKIVQEKYAAESLKEKAAMDCQWLLVSSLKEEVAQMSGRLASERTMYVTERSKLQDMHNALQSKLEGILDAKSILEAEIKAIKILKSWVEDEARKSQGRAKVLEEVGRRWKWDDQA